MTNNINLVTKYSLYNTSKIIIYKNLNANELICEIEDKKIIDDLMIQLQAVERVGLCDCRPEYTLVFIGPDYQELVFGYQNYPDHFYLRYSGQDREEQYLPSKEFYNLLNEESENLH